MTDSTLVRDYYDRTGAAFDASYDMDGPVYPSNRIRADLALGVLAKELPLGARVLDAGCGTGIILAELLERGYDAWGYDFSFQAIISARWRLGGENAERATVGNMEQPPLYPQPFDAALVVGAFTHPLDHAKALRGLHAALRPGGLLIVELRNELFDLFTLNTFTVDSLRRWLPDNALTRRALVDLAGRVYQRPTIPADTPVQAAHEEFFSVPSVWRNPLTVGDEYRAAGFEPADTLYFHWHCVPPVFEAFDPAAFRRESLALEASPRDWRGIFMSSAFLLVCRKM